MAQQALYERKGTFARITLNRPCSGNAANGAMLMRLANLSGTWPEITALRSLSCVARARTSASCQ